ncbi:MAG: S41 family peptidase [Phycisphaerales bacterium]|nr:S41 family peptidase [Phycisphaerales bacterium]NNM27168.1 S41 family peptidase [Phycisphaerales bacterium]
MRCCAVAIVLVGSLVGVARAADVADAYPATIAADASGDTRAVHASVEDVWRLGPGSIACGQLRIEWRAAHVVVGHDGPDALWAALFPSGPVRLAGERVRSVWLRFHPTRLGELFPPGVDATRVSGPEAAVTLVRGRWLAAEKMRGSFHRGGAPMVPPSGTVVVDVRTIEGPRRFFLVEGDEATPHAAFTTQALPRPDPITASAAVATLERVASAFAAEYAQFALRPEVDWTRRVEAFRPLTQAARNREDLAAIFGGLLSVLRDDHATVRLGERFLPSAATPRPLNGSFPATERELAAVPERVGTTLVHARTLDGIGYLLIASLGNPNVVPAVDAVLETLRDTRGLVIDLRYNGGGDERLARSIAGRFLAEPRVYSHHRVRLDPTSMRLSDPIARTCSPRGPWRYSEPVVVLIGPRTMSSAESFALMLDQASHVTTYGAPTAGSSGNPRALELGGGLVVNVPRWLDLRPDGVPLNGRGVEPDVIMMPEPRAFTERSDPVLAGGLALVRELALDADADPDADPDTDTDTDPDPDADTDADTDPDADADTDADTDAATATDADPDPDPATATDPDPAPDPTITP